MGKTLLIIESAGKKAKLEAIVGAGYIVRASFGHVRDLPEHEVGVSAPDYRPEYVVEDKRSRDTIAALKTLAKDADSVLLATDLDREGEAIAWHVAEVLKLRNAQRITYSEITQAAVTAALRAPRPLNMDLVYAQEARRVLDRLVGWLVSPALSDKVGTRLSAGRVQSPAVRLVVDRERAIRAFEPTKHFGAALQFGTESATPWKAEWQTKRHLADGDEYVLDETLALAAASVQRVRVTDFQDSVSKAAPPAPFTTSTLQLRAQVALKFKLKKTMELAQKLYEQGAITYMRTDSPNLSDEAFDQVRKLVQHHRSISGVRLVAVKRTWKAKSGAQEAHEGIRPTHFEHDVAGETEDEKSLYKLIWLRAVASQLEDAVFAVRMASLDSLEPIAGDVRAAYVARGRTLTVKGWKSVFDDYDESDKDEDDDLSNPVPQLDIGAVLSVDHGNVVKKSTRAPGRYSQSTLVKELEALGIGRPSTYAAIVHKIIDRGYVLEDKKGFLSASMAAETIVDSLVGTFEFVGLDYTRSLEDDLDEIANGHKTYLDVVAAADRQLSVELSKMGSRGVAYPCPSCGKAMRRVKGPKVYFWSCGAYPGCRTTLPDEGGKPGVRQEKPNGSPSSSLGAPAGALHVCPACSKPLRRKTLAAKDDTKGKGWDFWGCTGYPACRKTFNVGKDGFPDFSARSTT